MKKIGLLFIIIGIGLLFMLIYSYMKEQSKILSPIPDTEGVKVIFITPTE